jgi:cytochrome c peroxidase
MMRMKIGFGFVLATVLVLCAASAYALTDVEKLGGLIYRDTDLSLNFNQSCKTCHHPSAGFADPVNRRDPENFPVSQGSDPILYGGRNAPSAAYAGFSPVFGWNDAVGGYVGGMFWDCRATGLTLGDPLAEQAQGPFQNPVEMGLTPEEVVARVSVARYADLFLAVYPATDWSNVDATYNDIARAIAAYERSQAVTRFNSKFDLFWAECAAQNIDVGEIGVSVDPLDAPRGILSTGQLQGLALFNGKAGCKACHASGDYAPGTPPLFTDYTYDNIGIPTNPRVYELAGGSPPDPGLGGRDDIDDPDAQYGKFKVPTLRNVAKSAPYGHNGYFVTLDEIVNFYNMRDVPGSEWDGISADVPDNVNTSELGDLGLSTQEEACIVAFLKTLTDRQ